MRLKYRCLVMDHDDTVVNSTKTVHYPSFVAFMEKYFPNKQYSLDDYFRYNFDPGVLEFFTDICGMTEEEVIIEQEFWRNYVKGHVPEAFPGIKEILEEQRRRGGLITVISHSYSGVCASRLPEKRTARAGYVLRLGSTGRDAEAEDLVT